MFNLYMAKEIPTGKKTIKRFLITDFTDFLYFFVLTNNVIWTCSFFWTGRQQDTVLTDETTLFMFMNQRKSRDKKQNTDAF